MWKYLNQTPDEVARQYRSNVVYLGHVHEYPIYYYELTKSMHFCHPGVVQVVDEASADTYLAEVDDVYARMGDLDRQRGHGAVWARKATTVAHKLGVPVPAIPPGIPLRHPVWDDRDVRDRIEVPDSLSSLFRNRIDDTWWMLGSIGFSLEGKYYDRQRHEDDLRACLRAKAEVGHVLGL